MLHLRYFNHGLPPNAKVYYHAFTDSNCYNPNEY